MSFVARHLTDQDERLIYLSRLHWIYMLQGAVWWIVLGGAGIGAQWLLDAKLPAYAMNHIVLHGYDFGAPSKALRDFMIGAGFVLFLVYLFKQLSTEVALTSRRVIYKTGLFFTEIEEVDLIEIHAEKIHHGLLGRVLGYGQLSLDSRFVGDITLPAIGHPYKFLKIMHKVRAKLPAEIFARP